MSRADSVPSNLSVHVQIVANISGFISFACLGAYAHPFAPRGFWDKQPFLFMFSLAFVITYAIIAEFIVMFIRTFIYGYPPQNYKELSEKKQVVIRNQLIRFCDLSLQCLYICTFLRFHHSYYCIAFKYLVWVCDWCYHLRSSVHYERKFEERFERWGNRTRERVRNMPRCHSYDPASVRPRPMTRFEDEPETVEEENKRLREQVASLEEEIRRMKDIERAKNDYIPMAY